MVKQPDAPTVHLMPPLKPAPHRVSALPPRSPASARVKKEESDEETVTGSGGNVLIPSGSCAMDDDAGFDGLLEDDVPGPLFRGLGGSAEENALIAPDKPSLQLQLQPPSPRLLVDVDENEDLLMDIGGGHESFLG